jgi:hypothetical protein
MAITVTFDCPLDGLPLAVKIAPLVGDPTRETDGNFARDATQHVHLETIDTVVDCANGHRWRFYLREPVLERVDPSRVVPRG